MFHTRAVVLALALCGFTGGAFAADGDKAPDKARVSDSKPSDQPTPPPQVVMESSSCDECHSSGAFTHFWTHTVGGTIGHGLKKGAAKISSGF